MVVTADNNMGCQIADICRPLKVYIIGSKNSALGKDKNNSSHHKRPHNV